MKVKSIKGYEIEDVEQDGFVQKDDLPLLSERYQCGECNELYEDRDEALECCKE